MDTASTDWEGIGLYPIDGGDPRVAEVFKPMVDSGRTPSNFYRTFAHAPALLQPWIALTKAVLGETSLDRKLIELCVLRMAIRDRTAYVWNHHVPMARAAGATDEQLDALASWQDSGAFSASERAALAYAERLFDNVPAGAREALADGLDERAVVELTVALSFYIATYRIHRMLSIDLEPEKTVGHMPTPNASASDERSHG